MNGEIRSLTERVFASDEDVSAILKAALWLERNQHIYVDTIVGDGEFVYLYYSEDDEEDIEETVVGGKPTYLTDSITIPRFSLVGKASA